MAALRVAEQETPAARREAIGWLVRRAIRLGDCEQATNCVALAYDIDEDAAAAEIQRRSIKEETA